MGRYKYDCRGCHVRQQCISLKPMAPGVKLIIARAFELGTDTNATIELLQQDCFLVQQEREQAAGQEKPKESALARRIRLAQQAKQQAEPGAPPEPPAPRPEAPAKVEPPPPAEPPPEVEPLPLPPAEVETGPFQAVAFKRIVRPILLPAEDTNPLETTAGPKRTEPGAPTPPVLPFVEYAIFVTTTQRWVRLPDEGELVLGRYEYGIGSPPDVDLMYDQGGVQSVSHNHARLTGREGQHWIEDLGSSSGTFLKDRRLSMGERVKLSKDDPIVLGQCQLHYLPVLDWMLVPDLRVAHTCVLTVTHTGQLLELPKQKVVVVGRPDPSLGHAPDIDLTDAGDIARYVSRRHVQLSVHMGWHYVQDLGSSTGTRLNGKLLRVSDPPALLRPGDQLWLGGCVVAYEWRLSDE